MQLRFNGGLGAVTCDKCCVIIMEDFASYELKALVELSKTEPDWFCKECDPEAHKRQGKCFVDMVNKLQQTKEP